MPWELSCHHTQKKMIQLTSFRKNSGTIEVEDHSRIEKCTLWSLVDVKVLTGGFEGMEGMFVVMKVSLAALLFNVVIWNMKDRFFYMQHRICNTEGRFCYVACKFVPLQVHFASWQFNIVAWQVILVVWQVGFALFMVSMAKRQACLFLFCIWFCNKCSFLVDLALPIYKRFIDSKYQGSQM